MAINNAETVGVAKIKLETARGVLFTCKSMAAGMAKKEASKPKLPSLAIAK